MKIEPLNISHHICQEVITIRVCNFRAGGNGTAGTTMAIPVFEGENGVAWILTYACDTKWPLQAVCCSLGYLRTFSSLQASKVSTGELRLLYFLWRYMSVR